MTLPALCVIGAQKSGTSTLHSCLCMHSGINCPRSPDTGSYTKEIHFFSNRWKRGLDWYESHFGDEPGMYIDSTPNYVCDIQAHERLQSLIPNAKLIVSLRDPVTRAFSQFNHYSQIIDEARNWDFPRPDEPFLENVLSEIRQPVRKWYGMVGRGLYIEQIEHLLQYFPREQIHIVVLERWAQNTKTSLESTLDFLGLAHEPILHEPTHVRPYTVEEMSEEAESLLRDFYRPYNERLFDFLGEEITEWTN